MIDLPIEIWSYIFAIRRGNFELLLLKFENKLQHMISWKNFIFHDSWYYARLSNGCYYDYAYRARSFKFQRIILKDRHENRSGYGWGGIEPYVLTFDLTLPITHPGRIEILPIYAFKLRSYTNSCFINTSDLGFYISREYY